MCSILQLELTSYYKNITLKFCLFKSRLENWLITLLNSGLITLLNSGLITLLNSGLITLLNSELITLLNSGLITLLNSGFPIETTVMKLETRGSHGGENVNVAIQGCDAMRTSVWILTFQKSVWRSYAIPKR
jgi:hypothetical protein